VRRRLLSSALHPLLLLPACGSADDAPLARGGDADAGHHALRRDHDRARGPAGHRDHHGPERPAALARAGSDAGDVADDGTEQFRRVDGYDTSDVAFTGAFLEPNLEAVTALGPDLIVGYEFNDEFYDEFWGKMLAFLDVLEQRLVPARADVVVER
jgi:hypothetical protein